MKKPLRLNFPVGTKVVLAHRAKYPYWYMPRIGTVGVVVRNEPNNFRVQFPNGDTNNSRHILGVIVRPQDLEACGFGAWYRRHK